MNHVVSDIKFLLQFSKDSFLSPKAVDLTLGNEDEWMMSGSIKRCLDEDFENCNLEKKKRIVVKEEPED